MHMNKILPKGANCHALLQATRHSWRPVGGGLRGVHHAEGRLPGVDTATPRCQEGQRLDPATGRNGPQHELQSRVCWGCGRARPADQTPGEKNGRGCVRGSDHVCVGLSEGLYIFLDINFLTTVNYLLIPIKMIT